MNKKRNIVIGCCFFAAAVLMAVYGADFSWRTVIVGVVAFLLWEFGEDLWKAAFTPPPFRRYQFRIGLNMSVALKDAGLYSDELDEAAKFIYEGMQGRGGWITFTWLESELFFINTTNQFSSHLEFEIDLPSYGERVPKRIELADMVEMRLTSDAYELVLLTREQRYCWPDTTRGKGLVLFRLPYIFFRSLRFDDPYGSKRHDKLTEILAAAGLTYWSDSEVGSAWDYRNKYGSFRWWDV